MTLRDCNATSLASYVCQLHQPPRNWLDNTIDDNYLYRKCTQLLKFCIMQDLLRPESKDLAIREGDHGVYVAGVHDQPVGGMEDCLHLLQVGDRNRFG